jgi:uncharacterized protein (DUF1501 family)
MNARPGRREFLRAGLAGMAGLSLPGLLRRRVTAGTPSSSERTATIVVFLHGGASHLETYDPKPLAPVEYRGPYAAIDTVAPGMRLCELLPRHAQVADRFTLLRSMVHTGFCHGIGQQQMFTGHEVREFRPVSEHPEFLSITNRLRAQSGRELPNYVGVSPIPYLGAAYLGPAYEAFAINGNPNAAEFAVPNVGLVDEAKVGRLREQLDLRRSFDRLRRDLDQADSMQAFDAFEEMAWNMLTSDAAAAAFDLAREDPRDRDRYGRTSWGQQCLLARRLVEAGVDLVTVTLAGPEAGRVQNWDDHAVNHHVFDAMKARAPIFDQAVAALIEDVYDRGLDKRVMVVVTGEFGRTPKISYAADSGSGRMQPGRDHWPSATSLLFAGGGIATGRVIGGTDARGEQVLERRVGSADFLATVYRHLGVDPAGVEFDDFSGRPIPILAEGRPIPELVAQA